jgi:DNA ligase (NAD+)
MSSYTDYTESQLVSLLQKAADAYYNKEKPILSDEEYDSLREQLETEYPTNPYLKEIGAPVEKGAVRLPYKMASLNKIKPGTGALDTFVSSSKVKEWVISDKLDGISVLWDTKNRKLYLRGDGLMGVDVSAFAPYIHGLLYNSFSKDWVIRGELILPNDASIEAALPRSWVNGQLHQKKPIPENLGKIHFVAYELVEPSGFRRQKQVELMDEAGFEVAWSEVTKFLNDKSLSETLTRRRWLGAYIIDGIVIGENNIPQKDITDSVTNPKDMRAFKMPMEDQKATTKVVDIVWSASHQGYWIPRIQIESVVIGGSRIQYLTGHNARFIVQNKITKGSTIVVRKSGDVIPTMESVVSTVGEVVLPEGEWEGEAHYKVKAGSTNPEILQKKLEHFAKTLDIPHLGPGLVAKLITKEINTPHKLLTVSTSDLEDAIGKGMATKVFPALQTRAGSATEMDLMIASSVMTRGVGESKLNALFVLEADPRKWSSIKTCEGWSKDALESFLQGLSTYETWRRNELPSIPYPRITEWRPAFAPGIVYPQPRGFVCMTGFRDAELQEKMEQKGFTFVNNVTKQTTHLLVKNTQDKSEKIKRAIELGVRILTREDAMEEYL